MTPRHSGRPLREATRAQSRQLPLLALCVFGLLVAALALPPAADADGSGPNGDGLPDLPAVDANVTIDPGDIPIDVDLPDGGLPESGCLVVLGGQPVPGSDLAVYVVRDRQPVPDTRVWFNGRQVGRTDDRGRVVGRVPYDRDLNVRVGLDAECAFITPDGRRYDQSLGGGPGFAVRSSGPAAAALLPGPTAGEVDGRNRQAEPGENASATVPVGGEVQVGVRGEPYPGEAVTLVAAVSGVPFRNAEVFIDGERVGRTDERGRYRLQVPDREQVTLRVERGDFAGERALQVWTLSVGVQPRDLLAVPGEPATLRATLGPRPAADAPVFLDGERVGRTDAQGQLRLSLPDDPGATLEVRARGQVERLPVWAVYLPSVALIAGLVGLAVGSTAAAGRRYGPRAGLLAAAGWLTSAVLLAGYLLGGWGGLGAAVGLVTVPWAAIAVRYRGEDLLAAEADATGPLSRLARRCKAVALAVADGLLGVVDRLVAGVRSASAWTHSLPARLRSVLAAPAAWLAAVPGRLVSMAARGLRSATKLARSVTGIPGRALDRYGRAAVLAAGASLAVAVAGGYVLADSGGAVAGLAVWAVVVAAVVLVRRRPAADRADKSPDDSTTPASTSRPAVTGSEPDDSGPETLRDLWRRVARRVTPGRWRSSTPAEVERAAADRGLPPEPIEEIAEVFREVEYGDRPLSDRRWRRARAAYDRLRETWENRGRGGSEE